MNSETEKDIIGEQFYHFVFKYIKIDELAVEI